jgi:predicted N-acyltransferase
VPETTYSLHWFKDPRLEAAVAGYLEAERAEVREMSDILREHGPYRKRVPPSGG